MCVGCLGGGGDEVSGVSSGELKSWEVSGGFEVSKPPISFAEGEEGESWGTALNSPTLVSLSFFLWRENNKEVEYVGYVF